MNLYQNDSPNTFAAFPNTVDMQLCLMQTFGMASVECGFLFPSDPNYAYFFFLLNYF